MGRRIYPLNRIKYWWAYDIDEICELYKEYSLHPQTVRTWIRNGLLTMSGRPVLIYGNELIKFLKKMNTSNKCLTGFDQMFCMSCKDAKTFYKKQVSAELVNGGLRVKAVCCDCKNKMNKGYGLDDLPKLQRLFHVVDVLQLYDSKQPSLNTHLEASQETHSNESAQTELF